MCSSDLEACRSRRADWRMHQREKQEQRRAVANLAGAVLLIVLLFILVPLAARLTWDSLPLALLVLAMFALWSGQAFVGGVLHRAKGSPQALALRNLPLLDAQAFDYQWQARTAGQLFSGLPALVLATIVLALVEGQDGCARLHRFTCTFDFT